MCVRGRERQARRVGLGTHERTHATQRTGTQARGAAVCNNRQAGRLATGPPLPCSALPFPLFCCRSFTVCLSLVWFVVAYRRPVGWLPAAPTHQAFCFSPSLSLFSSLPLFLVLGGREKRKHVGWLARLQSIPPLVLLSSPRIFPLSRSSVPFLFLFLLLLRALPVLISLLSLSSRARGCAWVCASFLSRAWLYACIHSFNFNSKLRNAGTGSRPSLRGVCVCAVGELLRLLFGGLTAASGNVEGGRPACYSAPRQPPPLTGARPPHSDVQQLILLPCAARRNIGSSTTATTEDEILIAPCCPSTIFSASPSSESNISAAPRGKA